MYRKRLGVLGLCTAGIFLLAGMAGAITHREILNNTVSKSEASFGPGDSLIVYTAASGRQSDLHILNILTNVDRQLTSSLEAECMPCWSPDGSLIVYSVTFSETGATQLFTITPDGEDVTQLTNVPDGYACIFPSWSSDGTKIYFNYGYVYQALMVYDVFTHEMEELIPNTYRVNMPTVNATDDSVCYYTFIEPAARVLVVSPISNPNPVQITFPDADRTTAGPHWSRATGWIVYMGNPDANNPASICDIFLTSSTGDVSIQLTDFESNCSSCQWNSDGTKVVFSALDANGIRQLWLIEDIHPESTIRGHVYPQADSVAADQFQVVWRNTVVTPSAEDGSYELSSVTIGNQQFEVVREGWENLVVEMWIEGGDIIENVDFDPWPMAPVNNLVRVADDDSLKLEWEHTHTVGEAMLGFQIERAGIVQDDTITTMSYAGDLPWVAAWYHVLAVYRGGTARSLDSIYVEPYSDASEFGSSTLPTRFDVSQPRPNPFNPVTVLDVTLPVGDWVTVDVYDLLGRQVSRLHDAPMTAGSNRLNWHPAEGLASGVYFIHVNTRQGQGAVRKAVLMR